MRVTSERETKEGGPMRVSASLPMAKGVVIRTAPNIRVAIVETELLAWLDVAFCENTDLVVTCHKFDARIAIGRLVMVRVFDLVALRWW